MPRPLPLLVGTALLLATHLHLWAQHGVIRDYAAFAPTPEAIPLAPLFDTALTDISITRGPDQAFYLTGSAVENGQTVASSEIPLWRSPDLKRWQKLRTLTLGGPYRSPEIHFLQGAFWLTLGRAPTGTELIRFATTNLANSPFRKASITAEGMTPSLFLDDDGTFYWVMGIGRVARMKANPMDGLAGEPTLVPVKVAGPVGQQREQRIEGLHGAHLAKIHGKYHLFVTGRLKRLGLGRTGLPGGTEDVLVGASEHPDRGYSDFYVGFPNAGETTLFRDGAGALWATWSGSDERAIVRGQPAAFRLEEVQAREARWPIGFAAMERPTRFPFDLMLRPDTAFIYERGMGFARAVPLDPVPGQTAKVPWIRDTFIMLGHDGHYYLTGTSGNMDGINLWRSTDLKHFQFVKQVWKPDADPGRWYNDDPKRLFWAPELHYLKGTYWIPFCLSSGTKGKNSLLKSTSG